MTLLRLSSSVAVLAALATSSFAQNITSARSGTVHTFDGTVTIDGKSIENRPAYFPEVKESSTLSTQRGRAEVLLTPGVFLRIGENSSLKMLDSRLVSTRVQFLAGSAVLEQVDPLVNGAKGNSVTIVYKDYEIVLRKNGLLEITSEPESLKVYKGEAEVLEVAGNSHTVVKEGRMLAFNPVLTTEKFDEKNADDLLLWSRDRSQAMSAANMSSARGYGSSGYGYGNGYGLGGGYGYGYGGGCGPGYGYGNGYGNGGWYYNQAFGMYTLLPQCGTYYSPFGYGYYSPGTIYGIYYPGGYNWTGGGKATGTGGVGLPARGFNGTATSGLNHLNRGNPGLPTPIHSLPAPPTIGPSVSAASASPGLSAMSPSGSSLSSGIMHSGSAGGTAAAHSSAGHK